MLQSLISRMKSTLCGRLWSEHLHTDDLQPPWTGAEDASIIPQDGAASKAPNWELSVPYGGDSEAPLLAGIVGFLDVRAFLIAD